MISGRKAMLLFGVAVFQVNVAQAAYRCELFDRAENAPGGDVPALVLYSDTSDVNTAKAACSGLVDTKNFVDYWLKWTDVANLPSNWTEFNLLETQIPNPPESNFSSGVACIIYNDTSDKPHYTYYTRNAFLEDNKISIETVVEHCKRIMRSELPDQYRDFEVRYVEELPASFVDIFEHEGC